MKLPNRITTPKSPPKVRAVFSAFHLLEKIGLAVLLTLPIGYGVSARSFDDYTKYAIPMASIWLFSSLAWLFTTRARIAMEHDGPLGIEHAFKNPLGISWSHLLLFVAGSACLSMVLGSLFYSLFVSATDFYHWVLKLNPLTQKNHFMGFAGATVLALGGIFFWGRLKLRFTYGLLEAGVGVAFAVYKFSQEPKIALPSDNGFYFAMLTAGVYLVVRGFDNMHQGWKEGKDPVVMYLLHIGSKPIFHHSPRTLRPSEAPLARVSRGKIRRR